MSDVDVKRAVHDGGHSMRPALRGELRATLEASLRGEEVPESVTVTVQPFVSRRRANGRSLAVTFAAAGSLVAVTLAVIVLSRHHDTDWRGNESTSSVAESVVGSVVETTSNITTTVPTTVPTSATVASTVAPLPSPSTIVSPFSNLATLDESAVQLFDGRGTYLLDNIGLLKADLSDETTANLVPVAYVHRMNFDGTNRWSARIPTVLHPGQQESIWDIAEGPEQVLYVLYLGANEPQWSLAAYGTNGSSAGVLLGYVDNVFGTMAAMPAETFPRIVKFMKSDGFDFRTAADAGVTFAYLDPVTFRAGPTLANPFRAATVVHELFDLPRDTYGVADSTGSDVLTGARIQVISGSQRWTFDALGLVRAYGGDVNVVADAQIDGSVLVHLYLYQSAASAARSEGGLDQEPTKRVLGLLRPDGTMTFWRNDPTDSRTAFFEVVKNGEMLYGVAGMNGTTQDVVARLTPSD